MSKLVLLLMLLILSACSGQEMTPAEKPRVIEKIEMVEFIASHEEVENLTKDDRISLEHIDFELTFLENPIDSGVHQNQIRLEINVNHEEELLLGSTHFRLESYTGEE